MSKDIVKLFEKQGGEFISPPSLIQEKLGHIKAFIFDWDGVFNSGTKSEKSSSSYSEADSMGTNLLRFGYWLSHNQNFPIVAIITGENNQTAIKLSKREHFHQIYYKIPNKDAAFQHFLSDHKLNPQEVTFCFDDVLDFPIAEKCGLRFMVKRKASVLFSAYAKQNNMCDYISAQEGRNHAIREISELILGLSRNFEQVIRKRTAFSSNYQKYLLNRNKIINKQFTSLKEKIIEA